MEVIVLIVLILFVIGLYHYRPIDGPIERPIDGPIERPGAPNKAEPRKRRARSERIRLARQRAGLPHITRYGRVIKTRK